jgi:cytochrome c peroxidase
MHDGRFGTLESVLNHYSSGIDLATLDPILKQNGKFWNRTEKKKYS